MYVFIEFTLIYNFLDVSTSMHVVRLNLGGFGYIKKEIGREIPELICIPDLLSLSS